MLFNLSLQNIKKSIKDYSIYFITLVIAVAIFYIFNSVEAQESMLKLSVYKHQMVKALVQLVNYLSVFVSVILGFLIVYANNFLIKRRKKEIGLYYTLGMSKRKVSGVLLIEVALVGIISLGIGLLAGVGLSQFLSLITANLFEADMDKFTFIFSSSAFWKTIMYFGIIYLLVMAFNLITLSRYKLIDLLNAGKKNEKVKTRNKYVTIITFILAGVFLAYAYKLLFDGVLFQFESDVYLMIIAGALGTFLLFLSLSGFLLKVIEKTKKIYLKNLNAFILKQVNNKINTTVISTTIICLMLLLTIGILSASMSLAGTFNDSVKNNNLADFTMTSTRTYNVNSEGIEEKIPITNPYKDMVNEDEFKKYIKEYQIVDYYESKDVTIGDFLNKKAKDEAENLLKQSVDLETPVPIMKESQFNKLMKMYGEKDLIVDLKDNEYMLTANVDQIVEYYNYKFEEDNTITFNDKKLKSKTKDIVSIGLENYSANGNDGLIVLDDSLVENLEKTKVNLVGNYIDSTEENDVAFSDYIDTKFNTIPELMNIRSRLSMEAAAVGIKVIMTFVGLYLGITFAISSATVLAIGQLSESSDNKERYRILRQIGADNKMIRRSLFTQIAICFMLPLVVALVHAYFGLNEVNKIIKIMGNLDLASNIFITSLFIIIVYGGYFLATYLCSKNIIEEKR